MKFPKLVAASAGTMLTLSAFAVPQVANAETAGDNPDTNETEQELPNEADLSFEDSQGATINPGQTLTVAPDKEVEDVHVEEITAESDAWAVETDEETSGVKITAPAAPENQEEGVDVEYGEYEFTLTTNTGDEIVLTLDFQAAELDEPSSVADVREQLRNLSSNVNNELSSNLSSSL